MIQYILMKNWSYIVILPFCCLFTYCIIAFLIPAVFLAGITNVCPDCFISWITAAKKNSLSTRTICIRISFLIQLFSNLRTKVVFDSCGVTCNAPRQAPTRFSYATHRTVTLKMSCAFFGHWFYQKLIRILVISWYDVFINCNCDWSSKHSNLFHIGYCVICIC